MDKIKIRQKVKVLLSETAKNIESQLEVLLRNETKVFGHKDYEKLIADNNRLAIIIVRALYGIAYDELDTNMIPDEEMVDFIRFYTWDLK